GRYFSAYSITALPNGRLVSGDGNGKLSILTFPSKTYTVFFPLLRSYCQGFHLNATATHWQLQTKSIGLDIAIANNALSHYLECLLTQPLIVQAEKNTLVIRVPDSVIKNTLLLWALLALLPARLTFETLPFVAMNHPIWKQILATNLPIKKIMVENSKAFFSLPYFDVIHTKVLKMKTLGVFSSYTQFNAVKVRTGCLALLNDEKIVLADSYNNQYPIDFKTEICNLRIFNLRTGVCEKRFSKYGATVSCLATMENNQVIISSSNEKIIKIWDPEIDTYFNRF
ncbi:MAG: hypothetical protein ACK4PR_11105, partial [Gammaproteobacteria bacterium]